MASGEFAISELTHLFLLNEIYMFLDLCLQFFNLICMFFFLKVLSLFIFFQKMDPPLSLFFLQSLDIWIPLIFIILMLHFPFFVSQIIKSSKHLFLLSGWKPSFCVPRPDGRPWTSTVATWSRTPRRASWTPSSAETRRFDAWSRMGFGERGPGNVDGKDYPLVNIQKAIEHGHL